jgi:hypothetical protein
MNEINETALLTDSALLIYCTADDSIYVHADTLRSKPDSIGKKELLLYYHVKMFKNDLQGKCDSLFYSSSDSVLHFFHEPVLWSGDYQLSAEYIEMHLKNRKIHQLHLQRTAFIINQEDTEHFNQVKGKTMICHFRDNELYKINVYGNSQTIYYAKDKEDYIGLNKAESSDLIIFMTNKKLEEIRYLKQPSAILYPLEKAPKEVLRLKDFKWQVDLRPLEKEDENQEGEKNGQGTRDEKEASPGLPQGEE